jgi:hypothetical protein
MPTTKVLTVELDERYVRFLERRARRENVNLSAFTSRLLERYLEAFIRGAL